MYRFNYPVIDLPGAPTNRRSTAYLALIRLGGWDLRRFASTRVA